MEAIVVKIKELKTVVFSIYRPPGSNEEDFVEVLDMVEQEVSFAQAQTGKYPRILGFGDFNFPLLNWPVPERLLEGSEDGRELMLFWTFLTNYYLLS